MYALLLAVSLSIIPKTPNHVMTPGDLCDEDDRSEYLERRYEEQVQICRRNVNSTMKIRVYEAYGVPASERSNYTVDHLIPLSIGGSNAFENLWPEHKSIKATRPDFEFNLYQQLKSGEITQQEAIEAVLGEKFGD
jgi:hypothetical protein